MAGNRGQPSNKEMKILIQSIGRYLPSILLSKTKKFSFDKIYEIKQLKGKAVHLF